MLAGEWSILEPGNRCIVLPVNKFVTARIQESEKIIFNSIDFELNQVVLWWTAGQLKIESDLSELLRTKFRVCFYAIQNCLQFLTEQGIEIKPFELSIYSELSRVKITESVFAKPGLGSSAAVGVAVCMAILKFYGVPHTPDLIFKLAFLSHYFASGKLGSGFDVACSTYQKPIVYKKFDQDWLKLKFESMPNFKLSEIIFADWPSLEIKEIKLPTNMHVLVGFTGQSASTSKMIEKMQKFKQENLVQYLEIINEINSVVLELIEAIHVCDRTKIINLINRNRILLVKLANASGVGLETQALKNLSDSAQAFGAASKFTGAGGGDCGIAVCFDDFTVKNIISEWSIRKIKIF